jgi:Arc/MetJ-type ribon-helix-helix transcriptional regulator
MQKESKVTVKIPRPLYRRVQQVIDNSGFSSATEFIVYILRDLMSEVESKDEQEFSPDELAAIRQKLKNLGYL